jgi:hypothetical protein
VPGTGKPKGPEQNPGPAHLYVGSFNPEGLYNQEATMIQTKAFTGGIGLAALILAMAGCDSADRVQEPSAPQPQIGATDLTGSSEFDRELIAAKSRGSDQVHRDQAILAVLDKYQVAHASAQAQPVITVPALTAAAKTARSNWDPIRRNFTAGNDIHTYREVITVPNGKYIQVAAIGNSASVDPYLVAYYTDGEQTSESALKVKIIGLNDDISSANRNAAVGWTNNSGRSQDVNFVAFAYSSPSRGKAKIQITQNGVTTNLLNREIGGLSQYGAVTLPAVPDGCSPQFSRVTMNLLSGGYAGHSLVVDAQAMRGAAMQTGNNPSSQTLDLSWIVSNPYPSFALLFESYNDVLPPNWQEIPSNFQLIQKDHYGCVN